MMIEFSEFKIEDQVELVVLWNACNLTRSWNEPYKDISFAMESNTATILVAKKNSKIIASAMVGHDGHRGSIYYLAVDPKFQNQKDGTALMQAAETWLKAKDVWKINLLVREDNLKAVGF